MLTTKRLAAEALAKRKVMTYRHPAPERYKATPEQKDAFKDFLCWRKLLTNQRLDNDMWVKAFRDAARKNAEKQEHAAQYASFTKWET